MRKVRTASGATAVQIVSKSGGVRRIVEHLGSARTEAGLEALLEAGRQKFAAWQGQGTLDLESLEPAGPTGLVGATVASKRSALLWRSCTTPTHVWAWARRSEGDRAFEQMVAARLIGPTCKAHPQSPVRDRLVSPGPPQHPASLPGPGPGAGLPPDDLPGPVRARHRQWGPGPVPVRRHYAPL